MNATPPERTWRQNLRVLLPIALFQTVLYTTLNRLEWKPARSLPLTALDNWFGFHAWTVVPYMLFFVGAFPVALLIQTDRVLRQAVWAYAFCLAMTIPFFIFCPTTCPRPDAARLEHTWDARAFLWLTEIDTAACSFPSLHIILPTIVCWTVFAEHRPWAMRYAALMFLLSFTILTTKQHYVWDWLGGLAIGFLGIWAAGLFLRLRSRPVSG